MENVSRFSNPTTFLWQKFLGRGSNNGWRESKLQSFTKTAGMYSLTASPAFPTCWRFWMSPTTQRLQVLGSGMSGPVQLATGQGGCLWMSVVKLHTEGAWNNSEPFVSFNWLHPSYDLSPRREKSGLRGVCHVFCQVFHAGPTSKIKVSDIQLLSDKSWWSFLMFIHQKWHDLHSILHTIRFYRSPTN